MITGVTHTRFIIIEALETSAFSHFQIIRYSAIMIDEGEIKNYRFLVFERTEIRDPYLTYSSRQP